MSDICIIGVGKAGGALAIALDRAGHNISQLVTHKRSADRRIKSALRSKVRYATSARFDRIDADVVFITTQDPQIQDAAARISGLVSKGQVIFHTSGALASDVLQILAGKGCDVGSIHPLTSISDPVRGAAQFAGTYFCVEGTSKAMKVGRKLVRDIGGKSFTIDPVMKPLYHAAAVTSAGHVTAVFDTAVEMLSKCGIERQEARKVLSPLIASTVRNLESMDPEEALTGTFARLDTGTFQAHLRLLEKCLPREFVAIYLLLGSRSLDLVEKRSNGAIDTREFRKLISLAKEKSR